MISKAGGRSLTGACLLSVLAVAFGTGTYSISVPVVAGEVDQPAATVMATEAALSATAPSAERWAASPLIVRSRAMSDTTLAAVEAELRSDEQQQSRAAMFALFATALLTISLLQSLLLAIVETAAGVRRPQRGFTSYSLVQPANEADDEVKCHKLFGTVTALWARAETAVFDLDEALPLRALLFKELKQISQRLAVDPTLRIATPGALTAYHDKTYWKVLNQRLNQSVRDLNRIGAVADAAGAGFGGRTNEPRIPKTRDEACFILGANREADGETLGRLVKALRQCWHPDLAQTDQDRRHREARIKQINAAHDLITGKRMEG